MITPADIEKVAFSRPPLGKRGYNEDEVDTFLDVVQSDLEKYLERLEKAESGQPYYEMPAAPPPPHQPPAESVTAQASRILELAQQTADQVTTEAQEQAEETLRDSQQRATQTLQAAQQQASETVRRAEQEVAELKQRIEMLRLFEGNYHERLTTYMEGQLEAVRGHTSVEPAS